MPLDFEISAIVGFEAVLTASNGRFLELRTTQLDNGLALIPVTRELLSELQKDSKMSLNKKIPIIETGMISRNLTPPLVSFLQELSGFSPVAYCEAAYENGAGEQIAILWQADKVIVGPLSTTWGKFNHPCNKVRMQDMAINTVLRRMGVLTRDRRDEFEVVGLWRKRNTEQWC